VTIRAAGEFRRTPIERRSQQVAWDRSDRAFFAAGACHVLAWACRDRYPEKRIGLAAIRFEGEQQVFHTYATWDGWAFDHSGWHPEPEVLAANAAYEQRPVQRVELTTDLARFCVDHDHRRPDQFWRDPLPRAQEYVDRFPPPWS
jgi:hypothetical protein